jgi:glycosyltransferase involved in cell wall biosynthesis
MTKSAHKILLFVGDFAGGGTQRYALRLLERVDRRRFQPTVACFVPQGPLLAPAAKLARIVPFPLKGHLFDATGLSSLLRFARMLRAERFDVVHTLSDRANVFGLLGCALARQRGIVASQRSFDPITDGFTNAGPALIGLSRFLFRHVPDRITVNNAVIAEHLERVVQVPRERIRIVENGVDTQRFAPRPGDRHLAAQLELREGRAILGIVARLAPRKGHLPLLDALERFSPAERPMLVAAGEGPFREDFEQEVRRRGLDDWVRRPGFVEDPALLYNLFDAFCLPTRFAEGTPTALVEALASGVASVVSDLPQLRRVVEHEVTALFVDPARPEEIAAAVQRLGDDRELRDRLRIRGRELALERHGLDAMIRKSEAAYEEALSPAAA